MSVPAGLDASGLPLGLQLIGRNLDEGTLFSLGAAIEKAADFRAKPQRWW
jgi:aspartyl-tRNA(Asn)/glutamyl-tRNA(Gln) amidotransferase subunit A